MSRDYRYDFYFIPFLYFSKNQNPQTIRTNPSKFWIVKIFPKIISFNKVNKLKMVMNSKILDSNFMCDNFIPMSIHRVVLSRDSFFLS